MLNKSRSSEEENEQPTFQDRLVMAVLAPIVFSISMLIVLSPLIFFLMRSVRNNLGDLYYLHLPHWSVVLIVLVAGLLPAIAGFILGTSKLAKLLGHFFYTNMWYERDIRKTIACWLGLFAIAFFLLGMVYVGQLY